MYFFRTKETHEAYEQEKAGGHLERGCPLCKAEIIKQFEFWKIIHNKFPYDNVAEIHHMIIPNRHIEESELTDEERAELADIKLTYLDENYVYLFEALPRRKSIPAHFHLHLIVPKETI